MTSIDHFKVNECDTHLLKLRSMCTCKFHYRIWGMRGLYLIANVMRIKKERHEAFEIVKSTLGDKIKGISEDEFFKITAIQAPRFVNKNAQRSII